MRHKAATIHRPRGRSVLQPGGRSPDQCCGSTAGRRRV